MTERRLVLSNFNAMLLTAAVFWGVHFSDVATAGGDASLKTENVILITYDGLRHQELFTGADPKLLNGEAGGVKDILALKERFWDESAEVRREKLLPFFWRTVAAKGQVFGDPTQNSPATVLNKRLFSYPGYNEILTGFADRRIRSNAKRLNRNVTVLEWLHGQSGFDGRIAAFCSWDVFPYIINVERSGLPVNAGWEPLTDWLDTKQMTLLNELAEQTPHYWDNVRFDVFTFYGALEYLKFQKPRVLFVAFGETDDWAHDGRYDFVLDSARRTDDYIRRLWETAQSMTQYADKTTLILTTDHGRGEAPEGWKSHSDKVEGSDRIWIAVMGPDTPAWGVRKDVAATQSQVAATLGALLGHDYHGAVPKSGPPLNGVIGP
jgi:hypothetical protein